MKKIKSVINDLSNQKAPGPHGFTGEFYQASKKEIILAYISFRGQKQKEYFLTYSVQIRSDQSLSRVRLFATP